jgi:hypothetical protein
LIKTKKRIQYAHRGTEHFLKPGNHLPHFFVLSPHDRHAAKERHGLKGLAQIVVCNRNKPPQTINLGLLCLPIIYFGSSGNLVGVFG